jgi:bifunctional non-homologous end joining protein LigD
LGYYDDEGRFVYAGHVGTGFTDKALRLLQTELAPLTRATSPVPDVPREHARRAHWAEPVIIGEVAFRNWTPDGRLRNPSWRGVRNDRSPGSVRRLPAPEPPPTPPPPPPQGTVEGALQTRDGQWRVEIVRRGRDQFYRLVRGDNVVDGLFIASVERLLAEAGVDMADLIEARADTTHEPRKHGAA